MATTYRRAGNYLASLLNEASLEELVQRLEPRREDPPARLPSNPRATPEAVEGRWRAIAAPPGCPDQLFKRHLVANTLHAHLRRNAIPLGPGREIAVTCGIDENDGNVCGRRDARQRQGKRGRPGGLQGTDRDG